MSEEISWFVLYYEGPNYILFTRVFIFKQLLPLVIFASSVLFEHKGGVKMASPEKIQLHHTITKFYESSMKVVLESRIPIFSSASNHPGKGSEGNGYLYPCIKRMEPWSSGIWEPMIIDVFFCRQRKIIHRTNALESGRIYTGLKILDSVDQHVLLERWTIQFSEFSSKRSISESKVLSKGRRSDISIDHKNVSLPSHDLEKMITILLRSLYCTTRMIPAHSLFQHLCRSSQCNFTLSYRISASPLPVPVSLRDMVHNCFTPTDSTVGCMYLSVSYQPVVMDLIQQEAPLFLPKIITDYAATSQLKQSQDSCQPLALVAPPSQKNNLSDKQFLGIEKKVLVLEHGKDPAMVYSHAAEAKSRVLVDESALECPFAIDEKYDRPSSSSSSISDGVAIGSLITILRSPEPLGGGIIKQQETADLSIIRNLHKKTAYDALRELKFYVDFRDSIK